MRTKTTIKNDKVLENIQNFLENDEKKNAMEQCYSLIRKSGEREFDFSIFSLKNDEFDSYFPLVSTVILTANKFECDALNFIVWQQNNNNVHKRKERIHIFEHSDRHAPNAYILKICSSYVLHLFANETGSNTPGGSSDLVRYISRNLSLNPSCIISFGICYGRDPETQEIGDVIIPSKLYPWSIGQKIVDKNFKIKHDDFNLSLEDKFSESGIYSVINTYCNGSDGRIIKKSFCVEGKEYNLNTKVTYGNMSTGEAVISSKKVKDLIIKANRNDKELGGEMEGYGLAKECIYYAKIPCIILKGICDWGELKDIEKAFTDHELAYPENLKDKLQAYAAFCSGYVLLDLLSSEKDKLLSLEIINWLKRNRICTPLHYESKMVIINNIKKFLGGDCECECIFDNLVNENKLVKVKKDYGRTIVYRTEGG